MSVSKSKTAMRDSNGTPVFVREHGEYSETFPEENIVRSADDSEESVFVVFGFVGTDADYNEYMELFADETDALAYATQIYGDTGVAHDLLKDGEVFEVEVHEQPLQ